MCVWVTTLKVCFFTNACPNLQEMCINIMYLFTLSCRILPKYQWRSVWVSLPNQQLLLKKLVFTHCWRFWFSLEFLYFQILQVIFDMTFLFLFRYFQHQWASQRLYTILLHWRQSRKPQKKPLRSGRWEGGWINRRRATGILIPRTEAVSNHFPHRKL